MKEIKLTPTQRDVLLNSQQQIDYFNEELEKAKGNQNNILSLILDTEGIEYKGQEINFKEDILTIK